MSKPQPPNYDMTFCTSDFCDSTHECARHISHYEFDRDVWVQDLTNHKQECEHYIPKEEK